MKEATVSHKPTSSGTLLKLIPFLFFCIYTEWIEDNEALSFTTEMIILWSFVAISLFMVAYKVKRKEVPKTQLTMYGVSLLIGIAIFCYQLFFALP